MRSSARRWLALPLALALAAPRVALAQQEPPPSPSEAGAPPAATAATTAAGLAGSWQGWAKLTNDWPGLVCRYDGDPGTPSVHLDLADDGARVHGSVAIDLPAEAASGCPPLRKRYAIEEVSTGEGTASFTDSGGNEWTLTVRHQGDVLHGLLAWHQGGVAQPLAEGFSQPGGLRPMARLSGEVRVQRSGGPAGAEAATSAPGATTGAAAGSAPPPAAPAGVGHHARNWAAIIGVNLVGLGLLYGVNKLGQRSSGTGTITCSARYCVVGAPSAPCFCENETITTGASCGLTASGVPPGGSCDNLKPGNPCQSGYSCNTTGGPGVCEDRFGRCVF